MSSNNSLSYKRAARILTVASGLLFTIFSIVSLFVLQKDVVGALHYSLSQGKTHFSPLVGAIIITVVLLVFRWGINGLISRVKVTDGRINMPVVSGGFLIIRTCVTITWAILIQLWSTSLRV